MAALANTLDRSSLCWIEQIHYTHVTGEGNGFIMVVVFVGCDMWLM